MNEIEDFMNYEAIDKEETNKININKWLIPLSELVSSVLFLYLTNDYVRYTYCFN